MASDQVVYGTKNGEPQLLASLIGANLNTTADQVITLDGGESFIVCDIVMTNASTNINTATGAQFWTGAAKSGTKILVTTAETSSTLSVPDPIRALSASEKAISLRECQYAKTAGEIFAASLSQIPVLSRISDTIYFSLATAQGAAATCDIYVYGIVRT